VNVEAIYAHGRYCQSGVAYKADPDCTSGCTAKCTSIDMISTAFYRNDVLEEEEKFEYSDTIEDKKGCTPNDNICQYWKGDTKVFSVPCECSLAPEPFDGFCPIPGQVLLHE